MIAKDRTSQALRDHLRDVQKRSAGSGVEIDTEPPRSAIKKE